MYHITITEKSTGAVLVDSDSDSILGVINHPDSDSTQSISAISAIHTDGRTLKANILALLSLASTVSRIAGASEN